jgi:uncharacterized protein (DUF58 family)
LTVNDRSPPPSTLRDRLTLPVPTRRLAVVAASLSLVALVLPVDFPASLVLVDGALLVVAAVDWAAATPPGLLRVTRELPGVVALGAAAPVGWHVRNPTRRRLHVALADELAPSLAAGSRRARLVLEPGGTADATTVMRPRRRGRFTVAELTVRVDGPLGLAARQARRSCPAQLRVHPRYRSREEAALRINRARLLEVGMRSAQGRGGGTDFDALRDYSVDDESRRIDWAATARAGRAIVRTYRAERNQTVVSLLDNGRTMAARVEDVPRVEHAMDAVMMLTHVATRLGDRAGLLAFDREVRAVVPPGHGAHRLGRVTEAMYDLQPELVESDYHGAFTATLARFRRRAMLVLFTELAEQALTETLLPALPLVVRSHLVVVASVVDPAVAGWAGARPTEAGTAYRKAAAVASLEERRRVVARLRGLGVTVVDARPGELAPQLADAYLRVKATGRL